MKGLIIKIDAENHHKCIEILEYILPDIKLKLNRDGPNPCEDYKEGDMNSCFDVKFCHDSVFGK